MDKEEHEMRLEVIKSYETNLVNMQSVVKWTLIALATVCLCFTVSVIAVSMSFSRTMSDMSNDYFYSDYDYGTIEQKVDIRNGVE